MKKIFILLVILGIIGVGVYLYYKEGTLPVNSKESKTKIIVIRPAESLSSIAKKLANEELVRNKIVFYLVVKRLGLDKKIQAGDFRLTTAMNAYQIAQTLTHGTLDVWVTLIEGLRREEIAQVISRNLNIPETEFIKYAREGYLFPDTYLIPREASAGSVIGILEKNFNRKFNEKLQQEARRKELTSYEVLILASLVEKEARLNKDRPEVAGILLKRLKNDWPLQVDATVQYAIGYQSNEKTWWKKELTNYDLKINSPYNTYINKGLPPAPIANPGVASIQAVVEANENSPYWFYLSDKNGKIHYAKTIEEHTENVRKYLQ